LQLSSHFLSRCNLIGVDAADDLFPLAMRVSGWRKTIFQPAAAAVIVQSVKGKMLLDAGERRKSSHRNQSARARAQAGGGVGEGGENAPTTATTESVAAAAAVRLSGYFAVVSAAGRSVCSHFIIPRHITLDVTGTRNNEKRLRRRIRFQGGWLHKQKRIKRRRQWLFLQELLLS
jgi:hypothetical protein